MSDRPWWKRPPKPTASDVILERKAYLEATEQEVRIFARRDVRGRGARRSKIFSFKMKVPKKKKR